MIQQQRYRYLPGNRLPTWDDLIILANHNPTAKQCLIMYRRGDMSREECLLTLALCLADQNDDHLEEMMRLKSISYKSLTIKVG